MSVWTSVSLLGLLCHFIVTGGSSVGCPARGPDQFGICAMMCNPQEESSCPSGQLCCSNGCGFTCVDSVPQNAEEEWDQLCPMAKEKKEEEACFENMCPVMRCRQRCCYDGCSSFCAPDSPMIATEEPCPMAEKPRGGFGCSENKCPVMLCRSGCCYDGCQSFCREFKSAKPERFGGLSSRSPFFDNSNYGDYDYNNFVVASSSITITASVFLCICTSFLVAFNF